MATPMIAKAVTVVQEIVRQIDPEPRHGQPFLGSAANAQKIIDQDTRIYEAIKTHNAKAASEAMPVHLTCAEQELRIAWADS